MEKSQENNSEKRMMGLNKEEEDKSIEKKPWVSTAEDQTIEQDPGKVTNVTDGEIKVQGKADKGPSGEDMLPVIADILKEADFTVITLRDILNQLGSHFKVSLNDRKQEVINIIEEVVETMLDAEEHEENEGNAEDDSKGSVHAGEESLLLMDGT